MADQTADRRKWWLEATYVTAISAAIIVPGVTLLDHWLDYKLEAVKQDHALHLDEEKQTHAVRQTYLGLAIDPHRTSEYRRSVLTFLVDTLNDDEPMKKWAKDELSRLLEAAEAQARLAAAEAESRELKRRLEETKISAGQSDRERQVLKEQLEAAQRKVLILQKGWIAAKDKANIAPQAGATTLSEDDAKGNGGRPPADDSKRASGTRPPRTGGICCITCQGATICASHVSTSCGECGMGAAAL
jgi:hypothetical protein